LTNTFPYDTIVSESEERKMAKKKNKDIDSNTAQTYEVNRKIRRDWGAISPVSKIIPNKKKNPKIKHKGRQYDD